MVTEATRLAGKWKPEITVRKETLQHLIHSCHTDPLSRSSEAWQNPTALRPVELRKKQVPDSLKYCSCFPPKICPQDILLPALSTGESAFVYLLFWATLKSFEHRATKIWEKFKHWIIGGNSKLNLCLFSFAFRPQPFALVFLSKKIFAPPHPHSTGP